MKGFQIGGISIFYSKKSLKIDPPPVQSKLKYSVVYILDGTLLWTFPMVVSIYFPVFFARAIFFTCMNMTSNSVHTKIPIFRECQAPDKGILFLRAISLHYIPFGTQYIVPRFIASFFFRFQCAYKTSPFPSDWMFGNHISF